MAVVSSLDLEHFNFSMACRKCIIVLQSTSLTLYNAMYWEVSHV